MDLQEIIVQLKEISAVTSTIHGIHKNQARIEEAIMKINTSQVPRPEVLHQEIKVQGNAQKEQLSKTMT